VCASDRRSTAGLGASGAGSDSESVLQGVCSGKMPKAQADRDSELDSESDLHWQIHDSRRPSLRVA
jgi:hypothetical protein